ncbi:2-oxoacid:ferredoxin oxidoreductase subunit beta [Limibacterium fermenti]|uniref:2-oxoacid:ferredoxin oxidoreductase subunit beta n=1 Tax=Limibacterium fermenti TaxID=3229863 RepID=UPI000E9E55EE|nr:2-oxoacid:ferredoxin oxidoreductase subunit beta [Porphyromonadaceae bacterium]
MKTTETMAVYTAKDFKNDVNVRWCPGCGDHAILKSLHAAMAELNIAPHQTVVVSGIGCSSRLPYYMNTYAFHSIHGRAPAIATGVKMANPDLNVWIITGDGDALAIGGNHFIHALRRNIDLNIILFNNKIYGLTKGQYSPTSDRGFISKSSPYGTVEDPFRPAELCFGARGTFFARTVDSDLKNSTLIMVEAAKHKGASVVEVLQNCVIYNNGIHKSITDRTARSEKTILLKQGEKMLFGANNDKGIVREGWDLKAVTIGQDGYTLDDVLVHDATTRDVTLHMKLALMGYNNTLPIALGTIRCVSAPTYEEEYEKQIVTVQNRLPERCLNDFLMYSTNIWEVK